VKKRLIDDLRERRKENCIEDSKFSSGERKGGRGKVTNHLKEKTRKSGRNALLRFSQKRDSQGTS